MCLLTMIKEQNGIFEAQREEKRREEEKREETQEVLAQQKN